MRAFFLFIFWYLIKWKNGFENEVKFKREKKRRSNIETGYTRYVKVYSAGWKDVKIYIYTYIGTYNIETMRDGVWICNYFNYSYIQKEKHTPLVR